jgi:hypothetical protein
LSKDSSLNLTAWFEYSEDKDTWKFFGYEYGHQHKTKPLGITHDTFENCFGYEDQKYYYIHGHTEDQLFVADNVDNKPAWYMSQGGPRGYSPISELHTAYYKLPNHTEELNVFPKIKSTLVIRGITNRHDQ